MKNSSVQDDEDDEDKEDNDKKEGFVRGLE